MSVNPLYIGKKTSGPGKAEVVQESLFDKLLKFGKTISKSSGNTGPSTNTIYSVPAGKTFFMTNAWLTQTVVGPGSSADGTQILTADLTFFLATIATKLNTGATTQVSANSVSQTYSIPLKINAGTSIKINVADADTRGSGGVAGYEIDNVFLI